MRHLLECINTHISQYQSLLSASYTLCGCHAEVCQDQTQLIQALQKTICVLATAPTMCLEDVCGEDSVGMGSDGAAVATPVACVENVSSSNRGCSSGSSRGDGSLLPVAHVHAMSHGDDGHVLPVGMEEENTSTYGSSGTATTPHIDNHYEEREHKMVSEVSIYYHTIPLSTSLVGCITHFSFICTLYQ